MSTTEEKKKEIEQKIRLLSKGHALRKCFEPVVGFTKGGDQKKHSDSLVSRLWTTEELDWLSNQIDREVEAHAKAGA